MEQSLNNLTRDEANLAVLVLASQKIKPMAQEEEGGWNLILEEPDRIKALEVLELYAGENSAVAVEGLPRLSSPGVSAVLPCLFWVLILALIHLFCICTDTHREMVVRFGASAFYILQGEMYRTLTALMLHADFEHLAGNVVGIMVFGVPVSALAGPLQGMGLILGCGALGNFVNAWLYKTAHLSIGASTSVMGAAGILTAFQITQRWKLVGIHPKLFFPLGAGIALVGMLSGGENTDIGAHLFGFLAGLVVGCLWVGLKRIMSDSQRHLN